MKVEYSTEKGLDITLPERHSILLPIPPFYKNPFFILALAIIINTITVIIISIRG